MTGCGNVADGIATASETEIPETSTIEEASETVAETVTEVPETASEAEEITEETTVEEITEETVTETEATVDYDDSMFPVGDWIDADDMDETFYSFDENGRFEIGLQTHSIFGEYTFEDNLLTLFFDIGFDDPLHAEFAFDVQKEENGCRLYYNSEKSTGAIQLPDMDSVSHSSDKELIVGLSNLFYSFENRESFLLEYYEVWYAGSRYS